MPTFPPTPPEHGSTRRPFVGRRAELNLLRDRLPGGGLVVITGDPGIGKTRLVEELAIEAERGGLVVRWGRCWEGDGAPAFWPWTQILRAHVLGLAPTALAALPTGVRRELA